MKIRTLGLSAIALTAFIQSSAQAQVCTGAGPCLTFNSTAPGSYGFSVAILSDYDPPAAPATGGKRELAILAQTPFGGICRIVRGESGGSTPVDLASVGGVGAGSVVISVGNIDGFPGDEFAISNPTAGSIAVWSLRQPTSGSTFTTLLLKSITGPQSLGTAMVMVDTQSGRRLAAGVPGQDQVLLYDLSTPGLNPAPTQTLVPFNPQASPLPAGSPNGSFGASLAVGPKLTPPLGSAPTQSILAVGTPNYGTFTSPSTIIPSIGFVGIFDMSQGSTASGRQPDRFLYRGVAREFFGTAVASVGFLPETTQIVSPLSDFVVLGRSLTPGVNSVLAACHTPNSVGPGLTPLYGSPIFLATASSAAFGQLVAAGDIDGDGLGDVVGTLSTAGGVVRYSTAGGNLTPFATGATYALTTTGPLTLASGPDVFGKGATDVVVGAPRINNGGGLVEVLPMANNIRLPNPEGNALARLDAVGRPGVTGFGMRITAPSGNLAFLLGADAPPVPVLLEGTTFNYLPAGFINFGGGLVPAGQAGVPSGLGQLNLPISIPGGFNFEGLVFQAIQFNAPAFATFTVSNGILSRIGSW